MMRIACFQGPERPDTPEGNVALLARVAAKARAGGASLLLAPEMFLTGYVIGKDGAERLAETLDGASITEARRIAAQEKIALCFGFPERDGGKVFNAAVVIGSDGGLVASYRKTHLFGDIDRGQFAPGDSESAIFEIGGVKAGLLICYDVEFPENVRALALRGAELVIVPTAVMQPFDIVPRTIVPVRAYENQVFIAYGNRCGSEAPFDYCGLSCVVGPDGADLARAGSDEELIFADIEPGTMEASRRHNPYLTDRRPELYSRLSIRDEAR